MVLQRTGGVAQQAREVAARPSLEERRGDDRLDPVRGHALPHRLEGGVRPRAERELVRDAPQLRSGGAAEPGGRLADRAAHRVPPAERVGEGPGHRRSPRLDRPPATPARPPPGLPGAAARGGWSRRASPPPRGGRKNGRRPGPRYGPGVRAPPGARPPWPPASPRLDPSGARAWWTTRSSALATCSRTAAWG